MKEHSIIFSTEMVKAILDGRKTQTRRIIKANIPCFAERPFCDNGLWYFHYRLKPESISPSIKCPYGQVGDLLWVKETWRPGEEFENAQIPYLYKADYCEGFMIYWKSARFMPKKAARIWLEITNIRVERLQEISQVDIKAEGLQIPASDKGVLIRLTGKYPPHNYWPDGTIRKGTWPPKILKIDEFIKAHFASLWDSLNAKRGFGWDANPWVWVIEFKKVKG